MTDERPPIFIDLYGVAYNKATPELLEHMEQQLQSAWDRLDKAKSELAADSAVSTVTPPVVQTSD